MTGLTEFLLARIEDDEGALIDADCFVRTTSTSVLTAPTASWTSARRSDGSWNFADQSKTPTTSSGPSSPRWPSPTAGTQTSARSGVRNCKVALAFLYVVVLGGMGPCVRLWAITGARRFHG